MCIYAVTTCERAADALKILRENKDGFDVVISDVHMPDMDGFKLLELVGLEMDLPVISKLSLLHFMGIQIHNCHDLFLRWRDTFIGITNVQ